MSVFSKIKEAFVKSEDKDKYLSGLDRSKKSFGDRWFTFLVNQLYRIHFLL